MSREDDRPELKGTLGALFRSTMEQVASLSDVALREAKSRKGWLDGALLTRRRRELLATLGEVVFQSAQNGDLGDLHDVPAIAEAVAALVELEEQAEQARAEGPMPAKSSTAQWQSSARNSDQQTTDFRPWRPSKMQEQPRRRSSFTSADVEDADLEEYMNPADVPDNNE